MWNLTSKKQSMREKNKKCRFIRMCLNLNAISLKYVDPVIGQQHKLHGHHKYFANGSKRKAEVSILVSVKVKFKAKSI